MGMTETTHLTSRQEIESFAVTGAPAPARVHVMRVYSRLEVGGIEKQMLRLLPRLNAGRYKVSLCLLKRPGELVGQLRELGVAVHILPFKERLSPSSLRDLARLFRAEGVTIVQSHAREFNTSATVAARIAGVPITIASIHNMNTIQGWRRILQDRLLDRWRDAVVTVSDRVKEDYCRTVGVQPRKCVTIYNGLDLNEFSRGSATRHGMRAELSLPPEARVVITVARLVRQKAHEVLIEAARRLVRRVPNVHVLIVGEGHRMDELRSMTEGAGIRERFHFLGGRSDVRDLYRAADVSCMTSTREGFSNVVVESLASGLPVVATDAGGNGEALEDGVSGYLVPVGDVPGIEDRLASLLMDDDLRRRMSVAALDRARRFSLEETVRATESLYDNLLAVKNLAYRTA